MREQSFTSFLAAEVESARLALLSAYQERDRVLYVEAAPLRKGQDLLFIGNTTGMLEMKLEDLWLDFKPVEEVPQGVRCSVAVPLDSMPQDQVNADAAPGERIHPRRGDKVYIWTLSKK